MYALGQKARAAVEAARAHVASLIGAADASEIVFTSGGSESDVLHRVAVGILLEPDYTRRPSDRPEQVFITVHSSGTPDGSLVSSVVTLPGAPGGLREALDLI